jgi:hypothetical protein
MPPETSAWVSPLVMAGVVGRDKPGHDGDGEKTRRNTLMSQA